MIVRVAESLLLKTAVGCHLNQKNIHKLLFVYYTNLPINHNLQFNINRSMFLS